MKNIYLFKAGKFDVAVMKSREIHNFFILNAYTSFWTVIEVSSLNIFKIFQKVMLFIIFLLNFSNLYGQTKKSQETSNEIVYNLKRSEELLQHNLDSANIYAERANRLINKGTSNKDRSRVNISLGNINSAQSNYVKALKYYFTAKQLIDQDIADGKSRSEEDLNINVLMNIGLSFYYQKSYSLAMQYFEEALQNILKMQN
ncbi:MAG: tetratricopeptide repeat protein, partial [Weeksellaceae bacterium]|nr:tetratricopeptide repeat protein [Weeksellaceae bacterium]